MDERLEEKKNRLYENGFKDVFVEDKLGFNGFFISIINQTSNIFYDHFYFIMMIYEDLQDELREEIGLFDFEIKVNDNNKLQFVISGG